ncbi:hypothetical protein SDC9_153244 [bioreactor metagenome]|uniref:Uncharacterized protein n=1 Tax=bioreactor metagenome TaxID=1076179 RepID=A0A645EX17_9ZZZZ
MSDLLPHQNPRLRRYSARRAFEFGGFGERVVRRSRVQLADADDHRLDRIGSAGHDGLDLGHQARRHIEGVGAQLRTRDVRPLAVNGDAEMVDCRAVQSGHGGHRTGEQIGRGVQPERAPRIVQHTRLDEVEGAEPDLFAGLEDQLHRAAEGSAG